jgi:predicted SAM-dependent methyltransferase
MRYLNLGCGNRYHPAWVNMDLHPRGRGVPIYDLAQGIPMDDSSFDVVYHSHVLEHIPSLAALPFIQECCRVLRPGGILRVVVPDLERICQSIFRNWEVPFRVSQGRF